MGEVHAEDPVARPEDAEVGGHVRLGAGVRLDVHVLGAREQRERPLLGEVLGDVHVLAAAVVALARQALGVLVREPGALRLHHRRERVVLAGDQLDLVALPAALLEHRAQSSGSTSASGAQPSRWSFATVIVTRLPSSTAWRGGAGYRPTLGRRAAVPDPRLVDRADPEDRRRIRVTSTTVDGREPGVRPPSRTRSTASPSSATTVGRQRAAPGGRTGSPTSSAAGRPRRRARAGPGGRAAARRSSARPPVSTAGRAASGRRRSTSVSGPGHSAAARAAAAGGNSPIDGGLRGVGEEQGDRLVGRPPLDREQPLDPAGRRERHGDPVDGVGRERDEPPARRTSTASARPAGPSGTTRGPVTGRRVIARQAARRPRPPPRAPDGRAGAPRGRSRARAARSSRRPPPRRAAGRCTGRRAITSAGACGIAVPWPTAASISRSLSWSPIARTWPSAIPWRRASHRTARPLDTPGATNSRNRGWATVTSARPAKPVAGRSRGARVGRPGRPDGDDLRDRMPDPAAEVGHADGARAEEGRVVVHPADRRPG